VLTEKLFLGMNFLSLMGFAIIATRLFFTRRSDFRELERRVCTRIAVALKVVGTVLVAFGI
jgi:hypothetical protein